DTEMALWNPRVFGLPPCMATARIARQSPPPTCRELLYPPIGQRNPSRRSISRGSTGINTSGNLRLHPCCRRARPRPFPARSSRIPPHDGWCWNSRHETSGQTYRHRRAPRPTIRLRADRTRSNTIPLQRNRHPSQYGLLFSECSESLTSRRGIDCLLPRNRTLKLSVYGCNKIRVPENNCVRHMPALIGSGSLHRTCLSAVADGRSPPGLPSFAV